MDEENPPAVDDEQMEGGAEFPNKKVRRRKKQLYQNIRKQMEFYFSDANLTKDRFLGNLMLQDPNIDISTFLRFNKIRALTADARDIANALRGSEFLSVTEDGSKVFRTTPVTPKANIDDCTIYVEQLPSDAQHDWLKEVFSAYGNVSYVSIPKFKTNGKIKGFAFVEFETSEEANKTLEAFGAMGCCLSPQMAPEKLCSIQTFEEGKTEAVQDEEIKKESTDEDPDNPARKKKKKKKVKMQLSEETNAEENDVAEQEEGSENNEPTKLQKRKKSDGNDTENSNADQELVDDDAPPKKKKKKKSDKSELVEKKEEITEEDNSKAQQSEVIENQPEKRKRKRKSDDAEDKSNDDESESVETQVGKKKCRRTQEEVEENKEIISDETDQCLESKKHKKKSEEVEKADREDVEQEGVENEGEMEQPGEEMAEEGDEVGKKRRRRKKHKKKKPDVEAERLKILSKKEWKRLRNKYLDLQKTKMKCLKHYLVKNKWGRNTPARFQNSNGNVQEKEEASSEVKMLETNKKPRISYTPGVIVHAMMEQPVMDIRKFKADVKAISDVEYVDIVMGANEAFIRCSTSSTAENLISNAPWQQTELLKGDDEKMYWERIFEDRNEKLSKKVRVKMRGRDKVLRKAEHELGKHIRFDD